MSEEKSHDEIVDTFNKRRVLTVIAWIAAVVAALVIVNQLEAQSIIPGHGIFAGGLHKGSAGYIALMIIIVPLCVLIGYVILRCPACNAVLMDKITAEKCPECGVAFE